MDDVVGSFDRVDLVAGGWPGGEPVGVIWAGGRAFRLARMGRQRFNLSSRSADAQITEQRDYLVDHMDGHKRVFEIDWKTSLTADWRPRMVEPGKVGAEPLASQLLGGQFYKVA